MKNIKSFKHGKNHKYIKCLPGIFMAFLNSVASALPVTCCGVSERIINDIVP
jgi:hypothetical protein